MLLLSSPFYETEAYSSHTKTGKGHSSGLSPGILVLACAIKLFAVLLKIFKI